MEYYQVEKAPDRSTIRRIVNKLKNKGTIDDLPRSDRPKSVRIEENIQRVRDSVRENTNTSLTLRAQELNTNRESLRRIMSQDLNLKPYKLLYRQMILPGDYDKRKAFANTLENLLRNDENVLDKIIMIDEAYFQLNGDVDK